MEEYNKGNFKKSPEGLLAEGRWQRQRQTHGEAEPQGPLGQYQQV